MMRSDSAGLKTFAKGLVELLRERSTWPSLVLRQRSSLKRSKTLTGGWRVRLGYLRGESCRIEAWLDYYTAHRTRKLWYGFSSATRSPITKIAARGKKVSAHLKSSDIVDDDAFCHIHKPLAMSKFRKPILEEYPSNEEFYYGAYDENPTRQSSKRLDVMAESAATFIGSLIALEQESRRKAQPHGDYPREENRKTVRVHLLRERSRILALLCKERDGYRCRVCGLSFADMYGDLGKGYAEAHHLIPLAKVRRVVKTKVADLVTVCANCHRILHRMDGKKGDFERLRLQVKRGDWWLGP